MKIIIHCRPNFVATDAFTQNPNVQLLKCMLVRVCGGLVTEDGAELEVGQSLHAACI